MCSQFDLISIDNDTYAMMEKKRDEKREQEQWECEIIPFYTAFPDDTTNDDAIQVRMTRKQASDINKIHIRYNRPGRWIPCGETLSNNDSDNLPF